MERWKTVSEFPDYAVSDMGRVRRLTSSKNRTPDGILKPTPTPKGYLQVRLNEIARYVHRLVAMAFIPNPDNLPEVNHRFGDKSDNRAAELEWSTRSGNNIHKNRTLKSHHNRRLYTVSKPGTDPEIIDNLSIFAEINGLNVGACCAVARGKRNHHHGWAIAYAD